MKIGIYFVYLNLEIIVLLINEIIVIGENQNLGKIWGRNV